MSLNPNLLKQAIINACRGVEPGQDSVDFFAETITQGVVDLIKSGTVKVDSNSGACAYTSGTHPPVHSEGKVE